MPYANERADQSAHVHSLTSTNVVQILDSTMAIRFTLNNNIIVSI